MVKLQFTSIIPFLTVHVSRSLHFHLCNYHLLAVSCTILLTGFGCIALCWYRWTFITTHCVFLFIEISTVMSIFWMPQFWFQTLHIQPLVRCTYPTCFDVITSASKGGQRLFSARLSVSRISQKVVDGFWRYWVDRLDVRQGWLDSILMKIRIREFF